MNDDQTTTDAEPLLVRPYLAHGPAPAAGPTWPVEGSRPEHAADPARGRHAAAEHPADRPGPAAHRTPRSATAAGSGSRSAAEPDRPAAYGIDGRAAAPRGRRTAGPAGPDRRRWQIDIGAVFAVLVLATTGYLALRAGPGAETPDAQPAGPAPGIAGTAGSAGSAGPPTGTPSPLSATAISLAPAPASDGSPAAAPPTGGTPPPGAAPATARPARPGDTGQPRRPAAPAAPRAPGGGGTAPRPAAVPRPATVPGLSPAPSTARGGNVIGIGGRCLDLVGGDVQVTVCRGLASQNWTFATDGTLRGGGRCAAPAAGGAVTVGGCDSRDAAQWRYGPNRSLVNLAAGRCLSDPSDGTPGTAVRLTDCRTAGNQQWSMP